MFLEHSLGEVEVFAVIGTVFFLDRLSTPFAALVGDDRIKVCAITAAPKVGATFLAVITATGKSSQCPFAAAVEAVLGHMHILDY